ncbi:MAG: GNAT family N-acetyltransferase [Candidatus Eisenbacteria bacterium]
MREQHRAGIEYLREVTTLAQRVRASHPTAGLFEAADFQWWWRKPRVTDSHDQQFWFDDADRPVAAVIATDWDGSISLTPIVMPGADPSWIRHVVERGLAHVEEAGLDVVEVVIDPGDDVIAGALQAHGFVVREDELVESWITRDARPMTSPLHRDYRLATRLATQSSPHHMTVRNGPAVEERLRETSLYRPDLDLVILDGRDTVAAYGLFWLDVTTATGLVEPMRTEDEHQRRGLARHVLTTGTNLLLDAGAERVKICFEPGNPASSGLYLSVGFQPVKQCAVLRRPR